MCIYGLRKRYPSRDGIHPETDVAVAVPSVIAQLINVLYNIVDRIYIGRIPEIGATALTGVGVTFPIITWYPPSVPLWGLDYTYIYSFLWEKGTGNGRRTFWEIHFPC